LKRQTTRTELYDAMLVSEITVRGIHPVSGDINASISCNCGPASGKLRKELKMIVAWEEDMWDPASDNFKMVKADVERRVSNLITGKSFTGNYR
jgi:hypothetical protein